MISHFWKKIRAKSIAFWFIYIVILLYSVMNDLHFFDFTYADTGSYYEASGNPYAKMFYFTLKTAFAVLLYFFMNMISRGFTAVRNKNRDSRRRLGRSGLARRRTLLGNAQYGHQQRDRRCIPD